MFTCNSIMDSTEECNKQSCNENRKKAERLEMRCKNLEEKIRLLEYTIQQLQLQSPQNEDSSKTVNEDDDVVDGPRQLQRQITETSDQEPKSKGTIQRLLTYMLYATIKQGLPSSPYLFLFYIENVFEHFDSIFSNSSR